MKYSPSIFREGLVIDGMIIIPARPIKRGSMSETHKEKIRQSVIRRLNEKKVLTRTR